MAALPRFRKKLPLKLLQLTPRDQKAVKSAAETFRANKGVDAVEAITQLGVGEALISVLDEKGMPTPVEVAYIYPPKSQLTPLVVAERDALVKQDDLYAYYSQYVDNESAYELLNAQVAQQPAEAEKAEEENDFFGGMIASIFGTKKKKDQTVAEQVVSEVTKSVAKKLTNQVSKQIMRGILGAITK